MKEFDSSGAALAGKPGQLSRMINLADGWSEEDLPAMFEHQLAVRLDFDLGNLSLRGTAASGRDQALAEAARLGIVTFRDLYFHLRPPVVMLGLVKDFFKQQAGAGAERPPEQQVAYFMYLLSMLVGQFRLGVNISRLRDEEILRGIEWAARRPWADPQIKVLLQQAAARLYEGHGPAER